MQYFEVVVEYQNENEKGQIKKQKETVLVDAISVTESEAKVVKYLTDQGETRYYSVQSSKESKIVEVIN